MRKQIIIFLLTVLTLTVQGQVSKKVPERIINHKMNMDAPLPEPSFDIDSTTVRLHILNWNAAKASTKEACLTPQEAAKFFPIYKEMQAKQRAVFERQRQLAKVKPTDEKGCEKAIRQRDEYDLELKRIQQTYHNKFLSVISASKLYDVLVAEDRFHRQMLRGWNHGRPKK